MDNNFKIVAKTFYGMEEVLAKELLDLGAQSVEIGNRIVTFMGDKGFIYKANLCLHSALKILKPIYEFKANSNEDLYNKLYNYNWSYYMNESNTFVFDSVLSGNIFTHSLFVSQKAKDALVDKFRDENLKRFENFKSNLSEFKERFHFFKSTSDEYFTNNNEKFDLIYIDGWHEAPQVYKDINNSWDRLNLNGIIICDDYFYGDINLNTSSNLPANAINQFLSEKKNNLEVVSVNNSQIFIKKKLN